MILLAELAPLARAHLWVSAGFAVLASLMVGCMFAAGPDPQGRARRTFITVAAIAFAAHAGYVLAPVLAGTRYWGWSFWPMLPLAGLAALGTVIPLARALRSRLPGTGPGRVRMTSSSLLIAAFYLAPPVIVWLGRTD